uniref:Uncharacterized protein n=1 Tax=Anguilla anguilla TaxID=7936 RepID=A0A0E9UBI0_ANGAN
MLFVRPSFTSSILICNSIILLVRTDEHFIISHMSVLNAK